METQECFKCRKVLSLSEFYKHPKMANGHLGKCKECTGMDVQEHRRDNVEKIRAYDRRRAKFKCKDKVLAAQRRRRKQHPEKNNARQQAERAVKAGKIARRPCYFCDSSDRVEMHHPDYFRPLQVYWLCCLCHRKLDSMNRMNTEAI